MIAIISRLDVLLQSLTRITGKIEISGIFVFAGRPLTAPEVMALAEPLGLASSSVKSSLTRMVQEGSLAATGPARHRVYQLSEHQLAKVSEIRQRLQVADELWNGDWLAVSGFLPRTQSIRERLFRSLWSAGFRRLNDLFVRPSWPIPWARSKAAAFAELIEGVSIEGRVTSHSTRLAALYDFRELEHQASKLSKTLEGTEVPCTDRECYVALHRLSGKVVQLLSHDPLIPTDLVASDGLYALRRSYANHYRALESGATRFLNTTVKEKKN